MAISWNATAPTLARQVLQETGRWVQLGSGNVFQLLPSSTHEAASAVQYATAKGERFLD